MWRRSSSASPTVPGARGPCRRSVPAARTRSRGGPTARGAGCGGSQGGWGLNEVGWGGGRRGGGGGRRPGGGGGGGGFRGRGTRWLAEGRGQNPPLCGRDAHRRRRARRGRGRGDPQP